MNSDSAAPPDLEGAATEFRLAIGQLVRRLRAEVNPGQLTLSQNAILARLDRAGSATTADLARAESVKPQSMAAILASLEQEGLVQRRPHPTDGRQVLFALTDTGIEARRTRNIAKNDWLLGAMAKLDEDEQRAFIAAIALIRRLGEA
jgi:DNA-binding MarR family transcriptional regulator